ncbi:MAG: amidohydrolase [Opitutaceae bacterium]|nr:amidohydrolase [Opitutaceae bacterium]
MKLAALLAPLLLPSAFLAADSAGHSAIAAKIAADYPMLDALYKDLHAHPELSLMEERSAAKVAAGLRGAGAEVTEKFGGGHGVVGVLKNGPGPTVLIRCDLDGLPVQEETGLPYASKMRVKNLAGQEVATMHACGHDLHMTCLVGTARALASVRDRWAGTVVFVGQPAEEIGTGARAMLTAGLYTQFPKPDFALALHTNAALPAGSIGTVEGPAMANVDSVDITVRGIGGHGAYPHTTKDPIVLAARIITALQTIVSRETRPIDPAVVTVGSIHGGTKHNIIPDEVKLQLTLRSYTDAVREHTLAAIKRICRGEAIAAGLPDELHPIVTQVGTQFTPATRNDVALTRRVHAAIAGALGTERVRPVDPVMAGEDFSEFGRTAEKVPICLFWLGAVDPVKFADHERTGMPLPSLHSSKFAPLPEPAIRTGIAAMSAAALDLLGKK